MVRSDADILWQAALDLAARTRPVSRRALPPLLFFTDPERTLRPWETAARLPAGAGVVYRAFGAADAVEIGRRLRAVTRERGLSLLVGLDADLAGAVEADGLHLPERALDQAAAVRAAHPDWLLTGAAHTREALERSRDLDAVVLSPVFPAGGASADKSSLGVEGFRELVAASPCPAYALGGITAANARMLADSGACGIAGVEAMVSAFSAGIRT